MDADDRELIIRLCTKAGTLMEEASVVTITSAGLDEMQFLLVVESLSRYVDQIEALSGAAGLLLKGPL